MKQLFKTVVIVIVFTTLYSCASGTARINFTGAAPQKYEGDKQPLSLFACNNTSIAHSIEWGKENPLTVPFGRQVKEGQEYFISKYYIASPPLPNKFVANHPLILGVLSEDHLVLDRTNQRVDVFMDYQLLKPIKLAFIPVNYTSNEREVKSCVDQNINKVPINIRCPEFNYTSHGQQTTGQSTGLGKGIGQLLRKTIAGELTTVGDLFIPLDLETEEALNGCTVEIVNDIILEHQVFFGSAAAHHEKIDLTKAYHAYKQSKKHVNLYCKVRPVNEPAAGCNPVLPE